jgi:hypothetical protein
MWVFSPESGAKTPTHGCGPGDGLPGQTRRNSPEGALAARIKSG